jgi:hypothetical protein
MGSTRDQVLIDGLAVLAAIEFRRRERPMYSAPALDPDHLLLHNKLKESFGPIYLTVLSVIQGVALADLASVVQASYQEFTFVHWLLTAINFVMFIIIWNAYTIQSAIWTWIPDLRDAIIPFVFGALELFLNHAITLTLTAWFTALTLLSGVGMLANWHSIRRSKEESDNARLLSLFGRLLLRFEMFYLLALIIMFLLFGAISQIGNLDPRSDLQAGRAISGLVIVLLVAAGLVIYICC